MKTELLIWFGKIRKLLVWLCKVRSRHKQILNIFVLHNKQANGVLFVLFLDLWRDILSFEAAHFGLLNTLSNSYKKVANPWMKSDTFIFIQLLLANWYFNE